MFDNEFPFWIAPLLTFIILAFLAYRERKDKKKGLVQFDERTKLLSYKASHYTVIFYFFSLALICVYVDLKGIEYIKIEFIAVIALFLALVWLVAFNIVKFRRSK